MILINSPNPDRDLRFVERYLADGKNSERGSFTVMRPEILNFHLIVLSTVFYVVNTMVSKAVQMRNKLSFTVNSYLQEIKLIYLYNF